MHYEGTGRSVPSDLYMSNSIERWHIVFKGEVQFVGFRYTSKIIAKELGLTGFVRNLDDGSVEAEIQGRPSLNRKFLLKLKSQPHIRILGYTVDLIEPLENESRFSVKQPY